MVYTIKTKLLPTTLVGSASKPSYVKQVRGILDENSKKAILDYVRFQEEVGIDLLVDGEMYRGDMVTDYYRSLGLPISDWTRSYDNRFWKKGIVDKCLEWSTPIQLDQFIYTQNLTSKHVKAMLTGPTTLANWGFDAYYFDRKKLLFAWAEIIKKEALKLREAGAEYIQIDEPAIGERFWEVNQGLFREALEKALKGVKSYTILHVCYGEFERVYPYLKHLPVNQIHMELSGELDSKEDSKLLQKIKEDPLTRYKDVAIGVIDVRPNSNVESQELVESRIITALEFLAIDESTLKRIWVSPDCGFRTMKNEKKEREKIKVMCNATESVRKRIEKQGLFWND